MADDPPTDDVPEPVREWLAALVEAEGIDFGGLLEDVGGGSLERAGIDADDLLGRLDDLETSVDALDADLDAKIRDVRERVIQVKRESDAKAPADHEHATLSDRLAAVEERLDEGLDEFDAEADRLDERIAAVDGRLDRGFSNFEDVLEYLVETTDDLVDRLDALERKTTTVRNRFDKLVEADARRSAADDVRASAHRLGITEARCEECGGTVHLGLLTGPNCPHCNSRFSDLEPRRSFFRSSVLHTGAPPALEGPSGRGPEERDSAFALEDASQPPANGDGERAPGDGSAAAGAQVTATEDLGRPSAEAESSNAGAEAASATTATSTGSMSGAGATAGERAEDAATDGERPDDGTAGGEQPDVGVDHGREHEDAADDGGSRDDVADEARPQAGAAASPTDAAGRPVDTVSGVGTAFDRQLREAGIETVGDLARADPGNVAIWTDIPRGRVETLVDRAGALLDEE